MKVCIAEKPSVAKEIANVLGAKTRKDGYYEGNGYQVTWTLAISVNSMHHMTTMRDGSAGTWILYRCCLSDLRLESRMMQGSRNNSK